MKLLLPSLLLVAAVGGAGYAAYSDGIDLSSIQRVDALPAIPHVPIVMHAADGSVVPSTKRMYIYDQTLGSSAPLIEMSVGEYLAELNQSERELNKMGRSLRNSSYFGLLTELPTDRPALAAQGLLIDEGQRLFDQAVMQPILEKAQIDELVSNAQNAAAGFTLADVGRLAAESALPALDLPATPPLPTILPQIRIDPPQFKAEKRRAWSFSQGDPSTFEVFGQAEILGNGLATGSKSSRGQVNGVLGAHIFGSQPYYLAQGHADYNAPEKGMQKADVRFEVLGVEIYRKTKEHARLTWGDRYTKVAQAEKQYPFMIGFVPCEARIGFKGDAYFGWELGLSPLVAYGQGRAGAAAKAYASVAATVVVLEAGVKGDVTLIRDDFALDGNVRLQVDDKDMPSLTLDINATNDVEALSGRLFAYASARYTECTGGDFMGISYPKCAFTKKTWEQDFFQWDGFRDRGNILSLHYVLSPYGSQVSGKDANAEDFREIQAMSQIADAVTAAQRENAVIAAEGKLSQTKSDFFTLLHQDLGSTAATQTSALMLALDTQSAQLHDAALAYLQDVQ